MADTKRRSPFTKTNARKLIKAWVKALRSGRYKQTTGCLGDKDGYCCLGVACEVVRKAHPKLVTQTISDGSGKQKSYNDSASLLPAAVVSLLKMRSSKGTYDQTSLVEANDTHNKPFSKIADIIESTPALFEQGVL